MSVIARRPKATSALPATKDKNFIAVTEKIFAVLESFNSNPHEPLSLDEITSSVGIAKTSAHRLVYSMRRLGYIQQDSTGKYSLSEKFYAIGGNALPYQHLTSLSRPVLNQLVMRYGESVHIGVLESGVVLFVAVAPSQHAYRCAAEVGECNYAHSTALGKCLLANLEPADRDGILKSRGLPKMTDRTKTSRPQLELDLERIRVQGWALNDGENIEGVICVAAPIFGRGDQVIAALSMSGPSSRMHPVIEDLKKAVRNAAGRLSLLLGARCSDADELVSAG